MSSINANTIPQLVSMEAIPLHVNSLSIARYPWQTAILKATDLDNKFKTTDLKVKTL
jgi:hypothetical protein